ncbi:trehalose-phosphatase [Nocardioides zeae]|uniref:Trehalose 6-phosphate phosphatase n=1 Tax=Nocardioides imazamoxiresistens TaxID=3231893 RepID=A0ABU3PY81_9ACTN|nr:trehalose-phosphatase [Nocardioides zeae]MDT9594189.1 trehalose-phosphatase [Nocardioides zeae]
MEFSSPEAQRRYAELVRAASRAVVGLDFDGTLSPIVDDPSVAHIHDDAPGVLVDLAVHVRALAVVTGRPARQVLALGGLDEVGELVHDAGSDLFVFGQYGNERWDTQDRRVRSPRPPHGLSTFLLGLPRVLREADAADAYVEEKGLAIAVHTRRLADPQGAFERLLPSVSDLAAANDLGVEPGRSVIEVRAPGMHKGEAVRTLVRETRAGAFLFAGDDLGDVEAFKAVDDLRRQGMPTLLVCSASEEQSALAELADVVVAGPEGVLDLLRGLTADAASVRT